MKRNVSPRQSALSVGVVSGIPILALRFASKRAGLVALFETRSAHTPACCLEADANMTDCRDFRVDHVDVNSSNAPLNPDAMADNGTLTEAGAAEAYARIWNRRDALQFTRLLGRNVTYEADWMTQVGRSKSVVTYFLLLKVGHFRSAATSDASRRVRAETGITEWEGRRPCAILSHGRNRRAMVVVFDVRRGRITRIRASFALWHPVQASGVFPI